MIDSLESKGLAQWELLEGTEFGDSHVETPGCVIELSGFYDCRD
jgi:hypothetical protein